MAAKTKGKTDEVALVVATSDWHFNSAVGLCPPRISLDDGGTYTYSPAQAALWRSWRKLWQRIADLKQEHNATVYAVCCGDVVDVDRRGSLITSNKSVILSALADVAAPMLEVADKVFVVRGTEAHVGGAGELEEKFAADIGAEPNERAGTNSWWVLRASFGGVRFDFTHHPATSGRRPWTRAASAARQSRITREQYLDRDERPPDVAVFGHVHYFASGGRTHKPETLFLPPFTWTTAFGYRLGAGAEIEPVGGVYFLCRGGSYIWDDIRFAARRLPIWRESE